MNISEITTALTPLNGTGFIGVDMLTVVPLLGGKKNPMKGHVTKLAKVVAMVARTDADVSVYENWVNKRRIAQGEAGDFKAGGLPFGHWVEGHHGLFLNHTNKDGANNDYLRLAVLDCLSVEYFLDGKPIAKDAIEGLAAKKTEGKQGGIAEKSKMIVRSPLVGSIAGIRAYGMEHRMKDGEVISAAV